MATSFQIVTRYTCKYKRFGVPLTVEALDGDAPATREDQLGLKSERKKRNHKTKKAKKKKKTKKVDSKKVKKDSAKPGPRRRRAVLKRAARAASHSPVPEDEGMANAGPATVDNATVHYEAAADGSPRPSRGSSKGASPKAAAKANAKARGAPKPNTKTAPKAKAKAKAKAGPAGPKPKAKAKAKAGPARKDKAAPKKRGRPAANGGTPSGSMDEPMPTTLRGWWDMDVAFIMTGCAAEPTDQMDVGLPEFKRVMRDALPGPGDYMSGVLNVYWTRHACGLKVRGANKDLTSFRFVNSNVKPNLLQAVSVKAAQLMAI